MGLTRRQQAFVDAYDGNGTQAARRAGYTGTAASLRVTASRLLTNVNVAKAINSRQAKKNRPLIATREERQKFWTDVMKDVSVDMPHRLKAAELLGKSEADFTDKVLLEGKLSLEQLVAGTGPTE